MGIRRGWMWGDHRICNVIILWSQYVVRVPSSSSYLSLPGCIGQDSISCLRVAFTIIYAFFTTSLHTCILHGLQPINGNILLSEKTDCTWTVYAIHRYEPDFPNVYFLRYIFFLFRHYFSLQIVPWCYISCWRESRLLLSRNRCLSYGFRNLSRVMMISTFVSSFCFLRVSIKKCLYIRISCKPRVMDGRAGWESITLTNKIFHLS